MSHESKNRWSQSRSLLLTTTAFALLAIYVGAYLALTSRGLREAAAEVVLTPSDIQSLASRGIHVDPWEIRNRDFLYVANPIGRVLTDNEYLRHRWLRRCFKPLELLDPRIGKENGKYRARIFLRDLP